MTNRIIPWAGVTYYCKCSHPTGNHEVTKRIGMKQYFGQCRRCVCFRYEQWGSHDNRLPAKVQRIYGSHE